MEYDMLHVVQYVESFFPYKIKLFFSYEKKKKESYLIETTLKPETFDLSSSIVLLLLIVLVLVVALAVAVVKMAILFLNCMFICQRTYVKI